MPTKKEIFGFCLFDFANSAYTTVIITAIYSVFFVKNIGSPFLWSITLSASYALTLLLAPLTGAIADHSRKKKLFLFLTYLLCVTATAGLYFSLPQLKWVAVGLVIFSNLGFSLSESFVSSFLPSLSNEKNIGKISGYAWSFGYIGGVLSLFLAIAYLRKNNFTDLSIREVTVLTALFFGLAAAPVFFLLKEPSPIVKSGLLKINWVDRIKDGFGRIKNTYRDIKEYRELFKFLAAFFVYSCGITTVISFAAIFAENALGFSMGETITMLFIANITAAIGSFFFGFIQDDIGIRKTLLTTLALWVIAVLLAYTTSSKSVFWLVANIVGFAMGASQSASRSFVGLLSPEEKSAEFFGFWGVASKASAIVGLFSFGLLWKITGGMRTAIISTVFFFVGGFIMLLFVKDDKPKKRWDED